LCLLDCACVSYSRWGLVWTNTIFVHHAQVVHFKSESNFEPLIYYYLIGTVRICWESGTGDLLPSSYLCAGGSHAWNKSDFFNGFFWQVFCWALYSRTRSITRARPCRYTARPCVCKQDRTRPGQYTARPCQIKLGLSTTV
jgi:hypothetical protein